MSDSPKKFAAPAVEEKPKVSEREKRIARGQCVVDDGTAHMGRAVNGVVCSAHAMHYLADGTPRAR
jgi:hypothetical protein